MDKPLEYKVNCCGIRCCKIKEHEKFLNQNSNASNSPSGSYDELNNTAYIGDLPLPLLPGHCITVIGVPLKYCTRFSVNILCEDRKKSKSVDIALHFNPRLDQKYIVRNTRQNNHWSNEETVSVYKYELHREKKFKLSFFIAPRQFMISINDEHFCTFKYRMPLAKVRTLEVNGDVTVETVEVLDASQYPLKINTKNVLVVLFGETITYDDTIPALPNPFIGHLPEGLQTGWQLEIFGKIKLLPHSFYVNLQEGKQYWPHPIIPLHLNPRFNTQIGAHSLVRNSWTNGTWGSEERCPVFHFVPGYKFHLIIRMEAESFTVWVDENMCGDFKFRTLGKIDTVHIQGDLNIFQVFVNVGIGNIMIDNFNRMITRRRQREMESRQHKLWRKVLS